MDHYSHEYSLKFSMGHVKKVDMVVSLNGRNPIMLVECKKATSSLTKNNYKVTAITRNIHQKGYSLKTQGNPGYLDIVECGIFEENKIPEATFWFKPNGDRYGFSLKIPEDKEDDSILEELQIGWSNLIINTDLSKNNNIDDYKNLLKIFY